jgi:hypothetical protein
MVIVTRMLGLSPVMTAVPTRFRGNDPSRYWCSRVALTVNNMRTSSPPVVIVGRGAVLSVENSSVPVASRSVAWSADPCAVAPPCLISASNLTPREWRVRSTSFETNVCVSCSGSS